MIQTQTFLSRWTLNIIVSLRIARFNWQKYLRLLNDRITFTFSKYSWIETQYEKYSQRKSATQYSDTKQEWGQVCEGLLFLKLHRSDFVSCLFVREVSEIYVCLTYTNANVFVISVYSQWEWDNANTRVGISTNCLLCSRTLSLHLLSHCFTATFQLILESTSPPSLATTNSRRTRAATLLCYTAWVQARPSVENSEREYF